MKTAIEDGTITSYEVRDLAGDMEEKATEMFNKISEDLSEEEVSAINTEKEKLNTQLASLKATLDKAIDDAELQAKARLSELKTQRLQNLPA